MVQSKKKRMFTKIDSFLAELSETGRSDFYEFASVPRKLRDIQAWWSDLDPVKYKLSIPAVASWLRQYKEDGERTKLANTFLQHSRGICAIAAMESSVAMMAIVAEERYQIAKGNRYTEVSEIEILISANRELRSTAIALNQAKVKSDSAELILSGAYELGRKMLTAAKDHANEKYVEELLAGELKAVEDELRREQLGDV